MTAALAFCHGPFGRVSLYRINKPLAPHAHREGHLIFRIGHGEAAVSVDGTLCPVDATRAVAVSPWQPHDFRPAYWGDSSVFLVLYITPQWFEEMGSGPGLRFGDASLTLTPTMQAGVAEVASLLADGLTGTRFSIGLREVAMACFEQSWSHTPMSAAVAPRGSRCSDFRIRKALALMNERVADVCILDRIARDAGLSRPHFYKLFRQNVGLTPNMYLNTLRVERSIQRLTRGADPITSIGLDLGFASQASFTRFFSNNVGVAPTDYRRGSLLAA